MRPVSYVEGDFVHLHARSDGGIAALGGLLRRFHDATASFVPPDSAVWEPWFTRLESTDAIFGHDDRPGQLDPAGSYSYVCTFHQGMAGTINVDR